MNSKKTDLSATLIVQLSIIDESWHKMKNNYFYKRFSWGLRKKYLKEIIKLSKYIEKKLKVWNGWKKSRKSLSKSKRNNKSVHEHNNKIAISTAVATTAIHNWIESLPYVEQAARYLALLQK